MASIMLYSHSCWEELFTFKCKFLLIGLVCLSVAGGILVAEEPTIMRDREVSQPIQTWDQLSRSLPVWSAASGPEQFQIEICSWRWPESGKTLFHRFVFEHRPEQDLIVAFDLDGPQLVGCRDGSYQYRDSQWSLVNEPWIFQVTNAHDVSFLTGNEAEGKSSSFDLQAFFSRNAAADIPTVKFDSVSHAWIVTTQNQSWCEVRKSSPSDMERLGCILSEITMLPSWVDRGEVRGRVSFRSLCTAHKCDYSLSFDRMRFENFVKRKLRNITDHSIDRGNRAGFETGSRNFAWIAANLGKIDSPLGNTQEASIAIPLVGQFREQRESKPSLVERREKYESRLVEISKAVRRLRGTVIATDFDASKLGFDDPVAKWRMFDLAALGSADIFTEDVFTEALEYCGEYHTEAFFDYLDSIADLGSPPLPNLFFSTRKYWAKHVPGQELFVETIFRSHYMYYVSPDEIDATVEALIGSKEGSVKERVAVETLLRLDEYDRVPSERFQRWWDSEIVAANKVFRWETISMLTQHPGNRAMLFEKLPKTKPPLQREIVLNLRLRAESTIRTKRFDFMSEPECQKILALPIPPVLGRDSDGGVAPPFPAEE